MSGAERIAVERRRQIEAEGWTPEHDDEHLMAEWCVDPIEGIDPDELLAELNRRSEAPR